MVRMIALTNKALLKVLPDARILRAFNSYQPQFSTVKSNPMRHLLLQELKLEHN